MATIELSDDGLLEAASGSGSLVRFSMPVLQLIRVEAQEKFLSIPRGGLEIGGVLFGTTAGSDVRVLARRALAIEYLTGPSFILSSNDEASLAQLLETSDSDPALKGMQPVGWYHSHTRTDVSLSEQDVAIHQRFFPLPEQIALVIKPFKFEPAQVGIFAREADGSLRGDAPFSRFPLAAYMPATKATAESAAPPLNSPAAAPERERAGPVAPEYPNWSSFPPRTAVRQRRSRSWQSRLAVAAVIVMVIAAAVTYVQNRPALTEDAGPIRLQLNGVGDKLTIAWNPRSRSLAEARSAELIISDGNQRPATVALDNESLQRGSITYFRQSGSVEVRIRVQPEQGNALEEVVHFAESPPASQAAPAIEAKQDELDPDMLRIKAELERLKKEISLGLPDGERARSNTEVRPPPAAPSASERTSTSTKTDPVPPRQFIAPKAAVNKQLAPLPGAVDMRPPVITSQAQLSPTNLPGATPQPPPSYQPVPPSAPVPQPKAAASRTASGRAIWTGRLPKGGLLLFEGARPSVGSLHGPFPQNAARIRVHAADLGDAGIVVYDGGEHHNTIESPSAANGWNLTTYNSDAKRSRSVTVLEYPSQNNDWKRLLIRSDDRTLSMLVIDWEEFP
jgi:proteasome lid subunit RPN8/RPN11